MERIIIMDEEDELAPVDEFGGNARAGGGGMKCDDVLLEWPELMAIGMALEALPFPDPLAPPASFSTSADARGSCSCLMNARLPPCPIDRFRACDKDA